MTTIGNAMDSWNHLDGELARWLRVRTSIRAVEKRGPSSLDGVASALMRVRTTLLFVRSNTSPTDAGRIAIVSRSYRWAVRVARELESIEHAALDEMGEWSRFEAFAPFALAFFDSVLAGPFATAPESAEMARLRRELDAVLAPITIAMASSAMAA